MYLTSKKNEFIEEDIDLLQQVFVGKDISEEKFYKWKYFEGLGHKSIICKGVENGNVVVRTGVSVQDAYINKGEVNVGVSVDSAADASRRDLRTFVRCLQEMLDVSRLQGLAIIYAMPNEKSALVFEKVMGFKKAFSFIPIVFIPPISKVTHNNAINALISLGVSIVYVLRKLLLCDYMLTCARTEEDITCSAENGILNSYDSVICKDNAYLQWRYVNCPNRTYRIVRYKERNCKDIIFICRERTIRKVNVLFISDIMSENDNIMWKRIENAIRIISKHKKMPVCYFSNKKVNIMSIIRKGFIPIPTRITGREFKVLVKRFDEGIDISRLRMSLGDIDVG